MLDKATVQKVSHLARLKLTEAELEAYSKVLSAVLGHFEQISKVDTKGVEPLLTPTDITMALRPDENLHEVESDKLLANAPEKIGRLFKVPPVV